MSWSGWLNRNGHAHIYIRVMDDAGGKRLVRDLTDTPENVSAALRALADELDG